MIYDCKDTIIFNIKHQIANVATIIQCHNNDMVARLQCHNATPKFRLSSMNYRIIITTPKKAK